MKEISFDDNISRMIRLAVSDLQWEIFVLYAKHRESGLVKAFFKAGKERTRNTVFQNEALTVEAVDCRYTPDRVLELCRWGEEFVA